MVEQYQQEPPITLLFGAFIGWQPPPRLKAIAAFEAMADAILDER